MEYRGIRKLGKRCVAILLISIVLFNCKKEEQPTKDIDKIAKVKPKSIFEFGFKLDDYIVKKDTIRKGDTFGAILDRNHVSYPTIYNIVEKVRDTFDVTRRLQVGKPYTLLCAKDSLQTPQTFVYQPNREDYVVVNFKDSISAFRSSKPIRYVEKEVTASINSTISEALEKKGISLALAYKMSDVYAWTIDFNRLQRKIILKLFIPKNT
jgi:hypothetical protein